MKLTARVGTDIGDKRYEPGDVIDTAELTEKQVRYLVGEGHADPVDETPKDEEG